MAIKDILPTTNLTWDDIRDSLNASGGSVNNNVSSAFQKSAKINMWSKYKPVHLSALFAQSISSAMPNYDADWWKGEYGNCSIIPYRILSYSDVVNHQDGNNNGWEYELPHGGEGSPYRLGDFSGYNRNALPAFGDFRVSHTDVSIDQGTFQATLNMRSSSDYNLGFTDIDLVKNLYFGVYMDGPLKLACTNKQVGFSIIDISTGMLEAGNYILYPFLSSVIINLFDPPASGTFYTVPNTKSITITVRKKGITITLFAEKSMTGNNISYSVTVKNELGTTSLTNNYIFVKFSNHDMDDGISGGEIQQKLRDLNNIEVGTYTLAEGTFYGVQASLFNDCKVWVSVNSGEYIESVVPKGYT